MFNIKISKNELQFICSYHNFWGFNIFVTRNGILISLALIDNYKTILLRMSHIKEEIKTSSWVRYT